MKRGLKVVSNTSVPDSPSVTTIAPMKRGLKVANAMLMSFMLCVTTIAPMKRGLKDIRMNLYTNADGCYNHCPDEKGTESYISLFK